MASLADVKAQLADAAGIDPKPAADKCGMKKCHGDGTATKFSDSMSAREYRISGLCQACQDWVFREPPEQCGADLDPLGRGDSLPCVLEEGHEGGHKHAHDEEG